jgi:hypothetical protein
MAHSSHGHHKQLLLEVAARDALAKPQVSVCQILHMDLPPHLQSAVQPTGMRGCRNLVLHAINRLMDYERAAAFPGVEPVPTACVSCGCSQ